ncbi:tRNA(Met) cytidine acetyltransferase TmcA [Endozoicomonas sp. SCSIO W0465]|uniref:tRNA(Met) cytidine acetyltransferase TmcA n=1 Tax=Endozoicomonas sp. SCSIO W0465 TaxID=2918516 RepID=UPI002075A2A9|nr:GNAT family N-acetyltransferase [Endozoicomonas sp. SCSIO W0465]USE38970.1 GNAT family N-acetyltransferase [Endozoicomonas sp. SCSIO W0465]
MSQQTISSTGELVRSLKSAARLSGHRRLLVCAGSADWCETQVVEMVHALTGESVLLIGEDFPGLTVSDLVNSYIEAIAAKKCLSRLGAEHQNIIFNAYAGFDVDAFGAISGTLCAGGLMVLLTPALDQWQYFHDPEHHRMQVYPQQFEDVSGRYLQRLSQIIKTSDLLSLITESGELRIQWVNSHPEKDTLAEQGEMVTAPCKTRSQMRAVQAIHKVFRGHRRRPLVLTADRGRGKSASLGIAAAQLLLEGADQITITAPSRNTADVFFQHAGKVLGECHAALLNRLHFIAPDDLVQTLPATQLLLVDEAAAIPTPVLEKMLTHYSRIVYATTIHGYEGTGRGFAIRFTKVLDSKTPQWHELRMIEPVRWQPEDPLERFVFRALLLNAVPAVIDQPENISPEQCIFRQISSEELVSNEDLLAQMFGLLVLAHYQTRPFDLRHLLDGGNMEIYGLFARQKRLVAVLLAAREGEIESALIDDIWMGRRRVRGHLLPQSLSNHLGLPEAIFLKGLRIIRIAVHPDCQRKGLGRAVLDKLQQDAAVKNIDYLGTVFGATDDLLQFWDDSSYVPVRVGLSRDAASGTHAAMMLKPLSLPAQHLIHKAHKKCLFQLQWLLMDELRDLDVEVVATLLAIMAPIIRASDYYALSCDDQRELVSFTEGRRQYENCVDVIKRVTFRILGVGDINTADVRLLVSRVIQNHSWHQVAAACNVSGEKQARQRLRELIAVKSRLHLSGC